MTNLQFESARLQLRCATVDLLRAELEQGAIGLGDALACNTPADWPSEHWDAGPISFTIDRLSRFPQETGWWAWYVLKKARNSNDRPMLIGTCGYKGPPKGGEVEIGYGIVCCERRRGFATEASQALIQRAFDWRDATGRAPVTIVAAQTMPELVSSIGVMQKLGMRFIAAGGEAGAIKYAVSRQSWTSSGPPAVQVRQIPRLPAEQ